MKRMRGHLLTWAVVISALLYLACFAYPAISLRGIYGASVLLLGIDLALPTGIFAMGGWIFTWLANVFLVLSWAFASSADTKRCFNMSLISFALGLQTVLFNSIKVQDKSGSCCLRIDEYHIGFYLWMSSITVVLAATIILTIFKPDISKSS
jgi:hypothetical protein